MTKDSAKIAPTDAEDHARHLTQVVRDGSNPNQRPRHAATLIVIDRSGGTPKILMGKRHAGHKFMPGKFVFPGGRIEPGDRKMNVAGALPAVVEEKLNKRRTRPSPTLARALALAALRETFEETGLVIGETSYGAPPQPPPGVWSEFAAHGVFPDLQNLCFIARAITPPRRPKRFDTAFFAIDAEHIAERVEGIVTPDSELVELVWIAIDKARELDLPHITGVVLRELAARIAAGMGAHLPVPFYHERNRIWRREEL